MDIECGMLRFCPGTRLALVGKMTQGYYRYYVRVIVTLILLRNPDHSNIRSQTGTVNDTVHAAVLPTSAKCVILIGRYQVPGNPLRS